MSAVTGASKVEATRRSQRSDRVVAAGLIAITLVGAMISSLGAPLIPSIARSTGASLSNAQWTLTITVLVSVAVTPVMGRLTDTRRRRSTILIALALVTLGGVIAALNTSNLALLLLGRALQGFGQGLAPMMIGIARAALAGRRQSSTISILSITNAAGVGLGYPLTGLLDRAFGIAGAFLIGGALSSALALIIAALVVPANRTQSEPPVDIIGSVLFALSVGALLLALAQGQTWGWSSAAVRVLFAAALVIGGAWVWQQLRSAHPLVELRLLRIRPVLTADITVLLGGIGMYLLLTLTTRIVQAPANTGGLGHGAIIAGLAMLPLSAGSLAATWLARWLRHHLPGPVLLPTAALIMIVAMVLFAVSRHNLAGLLVTMAIAGVGIGLVFALVPTLIVGHVPESDTGSALSFNQIFRYVGYSLGSVLTATVLQAYTPAGNPYPSSHAYLAASIAGAIVWTTAGLASLATYLTRHSRELVPQEAQP